MNENMILPTRCSLAVGEACGRDVAMTPVFLRNSPTEPFVRVPMAYAVQALHAEVAKETRRDEHKARERAAWQR